MDLWEINKLHLFLLFFVPGFISMSVYDLLIAAERRRFTDEVPRVIAFSCLNISALAPIIVRDQSAKYLAAHPILFWAVFYGAIFIFPAVWPAAVVWLRRGPLARWMVQPIAKPWDWVFSRRDRVGKWVIVHLRDGTKIGGVFGTNSYASSYPAREQLYLERVWSVDPDTGTFVESIDRSEGVVVLGEDVLAVEFFSGEEGPDESPSDREGV